MIFVTQRDSKKLYQNALEVFLYDCRRYRSWSIVRHIVRILFYVFCAVFSLIPKKRKVYFHRKIFIIEHYRENYLNRIPNDQETLIMTSNFRVYLTCKRSRRNEVVLFQAILLNTFHDVHSCLRLAKNGSNSIIEFVEMTVGSILLTGCVNVFEYHEWKFVDEVISFSDKNIFSAGACISKVRSKTKVYQHGFPGYLYFPVLAEQAHVWSKYFKDIYKKNNVKNIVVSGYPFELGNMCNLPDQYDTMLFVQTKYSLRQELENITLLEQFCQRVDCRIHIKLRPNASKADKARYSGLLKYPGVCLIDRVEYHHGYRFVLTHCSGMWYEMAFLGVPPIFLSSEDNLHVIPCYQDSLHYTNTVENLIIIYNKYCEKARYLEYKRIALRHSRDVLGL